MKCLVCETNVRNDYIFCPNCGALLSTQTYQSTTYSYYYPQVEHQKISDKVIIDKINSLSSKREFYFRLLLTLGFFSLLFMFSFICFTTMMYSGYLRGGIGGLITWFIASVLSIFFSIFMLLLIRQIDLYEKEPWGLIIFSFFWGALGSTILSLFMNEINNIIFSSIFGRDIGSIMTATISAPIFEEFFKLLVIPIIIILFRVNFNSPMDGLVYIFASSLGFKIVEDLVYGAQFTAQTGAIYGFILLVLVRWIMGFLGHPLMSMFSGFAVGLATVTSNFFLKLVYITIGYLLSVGAHFVWNFMASVGPNLLGWYVCLWFPLQTTILIIIFIFLYFIALNIEKNILRTTLYEDVKNGFLTSEIVEELTDFRLRNIKKQSLSNEQKKLYEILMHELAIYALLKKQSNQSLGNEIQKTLQEKKEIINYLKPYLIGGVS
ncbi:MAG: PrsW family intramembrane metalloprotease [bacterium]|nr:PrsW family intramembrane metalloprotease [bacterium]